MIIITIGDIIGLAILSIGISIGILVMIGVYLNDKIKNRTK
jgi:uncharacterized protein YneF (UPF0154 family)